MRGNRHNAPHTKNTREDPVKTHPRIRTEHLDLIPATVKIWKATSTTTRGLPGLLDAKVPLAWPPGGMNDEVLTEFIRMASEKTDPFFACCYWVLDTPVREGASSSESAESHRHSTRRIRSSSGTRCWTSTRTGGTQPRQSTT